MKFTSYQNRAQLSGPNSGVSNFHYSNPGAVAEVKEAGNLGVTIAKGALGFIDQVNSAKALEANNYYNQRMSEETADIINNHKEGNALDVMSMYDDRQQKVMDDTQKRFGKYIKFGPAAQAFHEYTMRDNATRRGNMEKYHTAEMEKYQQTVYANGVNSCLQAAIDGGYSDDAIAGAINKGGALTASRFATYGRERIELEQRKIAGDIASGALQAALDGGNNSRAQEIAERYKAVLPPAIRAKAMAIADKRTAANDDLQFQKYIYEKYGRDVTPEQINDELVAKYGNTANMDAVFAPFDGKTMENGVVGCAEFVTKFGKELKNPLVMKMQEEGSYNVNWVPDFRKAAAKYGFREDTAGIPHAGDILITSDDNDDEKHIVIADGKGGYYGNSSGQNKAIHGNNIEDLGSVNYIIRTGTTGRQLDDVEREKRTNDIMSYVNHQEAVKKQQEGRILDDAKLQLNKLLLNGGTVSEGDVENIISSHLTGDDRVDVPLQMLGRALLKDSTRKAGGGNSSGGSGGKNMRPAFDLDYADALNRNWRGEASAIAQAYNDWQNGVLNDKEYNEARKLIDQKAKNKGMFAFDDVSGVREAVKSLTGNYGGWGADFNTAYKLAADQAAQYERDHGRSFNEQQWIDQIVEFMTNTRTIELDNGSFWGGKDEITFTDVQLENRGIKELTENPDGTFIIKDDEGSWTATQDQVRRIKDYNGYYRDVF